MNLVAVPDGDHSFLLDCDECGPLGVVERAVLHTTANTHLLDHGIETPVTPLCSCGYDYSKVTGHEKDHAECTRCAWTASGIFADHMAVHHYLDKNHAWHLTMGDRL